MKHLFSAFLFCLFFLPVSSQTTFQQTFDLNQDDEFYACTQTSDGGFLFGGYSIGVPYGGIVVKTNSAGTVQWSKTVGGARISDVVESTTGMFYVAGENVVNGNTNFYLVKLNGSGTVQWARNYGKSTDPDNLYSLALTPDGGVILSGNADSLTGAGFLPVGYVVKVDSSGNHQWSRYVSGGNGEILYVTKPLSSGGYLSCGYTGSFGSPVGTEAYVVRWDANGTILWTNVFGHSNRFDRIYDFVEKPNGGFFVTGKGLYTSTTDNLFIASLDNSGDVVWHHNYSMFDDVNRIMMLQDGNLAVCGYNVDQNLGIYNQSYLIKTDTTGQVLWGKQYGASGVIDDKLWCAVETSDGGFLLSGSTYGTGTQRTCWVVRADSAGTSTCRDSVLNVVRTNLTIASTSGGTAWPTSLTTNSTVGQLNANMTMQYFCGGPNTVHSETVNQCAVKVFPVPVSGVINIEADPELYSEAGLYDALGRKVKSIPILNLQSQIDVSDMRPGVYTLSLTGTANLSAKVIIE